MARVYLGIDITDPKQTPSVNCGDTDEACKIKETINLAFTTYWGGSVGMTLKGVPYHIEKQLKYDPVPKFPSYLTKSPIAHHYRLTPLPNLPASHLNGNGLRLFMDYIGSGVFDEEMIYTNAITQSNLFNQHALMYYKASYKELYTAWYFTHLIRKVSDALPDAGGYRDFSIEGWNKIDSQLSLPALSFPEVQFLFSNLSILDEAWKGIISGHSDVIQDRQNELASSNYLKKREDVLPFENLSDFLVFLLVKVPSLWDNLPGYPTHFAPGEKYSFEAFDSAALRIIKEQLVKDRYRFGTVEDLLKWSTGASRAGTSFYDQDIKQPGDNILYISSKNQIHAIHKAVGEERYEAILSSTSMLPPVTTDQAGAAEKDREEYVQKILNGTLGNVNTLSQVPFESVTDLGESGTKNYKVKYPYYLKTNKTAWTWRWFRESLWSDAHREGDISVRELVFEYYTSFIMAVVEDSLDLNTFRNDSKIGEKFNDALWGPYGVGGTIKDSTDPSLLGDCMALILANHENLLRIAIWQAAKEDVEEHGTGWDPAREAGLKADLAALENELLKAKTTGVAPAAPTDPDLTTEEQLTRQEISGRQNFFKQCALLLNAQALKQVLHSSIIDKLTDGSQAEPLRPFMGRLHMLKTKNDQDRLLNDLTTGRSVAGFFDLSPGEVSNMVPRVRIYRVRNKIQGTLEETEFILPSTTDLDRKVGYFRQDRNFCDSPFDKGEGMGLKQFSFEFNGTNPAESRNDIEATLTLFFQSFNDLVRDRVSSNGEVYKFVDLIIQPDFRNKSGFRPVHTNQYDPAFFRIRADVGYIRETAPERLRKAIDVTNTSYYLNMVDHDIKIAADGSVTVNISYRAYVESALKSNKYDALATPQLIERRTANLKQLVFMLESGQCSVSQIQDLKLAMSAQSAMVRRTSLSSILHRLEKRDKIHVCRVSPNAAKSFRRHGFFLEGAPLVKVDNKTEQVTSGDQLVRAENYTRGSDALNNLLGGRISKSNYNDVDDSIIQYFFFADLLEIICDSMYDPMDQNKPAEGMENLKFILGSFDFNPYSTSSRANANQVLNIGEIPIALDYFTQWFIQNIITQGLTREAFPIMTFLRNLSSNLLSTSLLETCVNRNIKKNLIFRTTALPAWSNTTTDPIGNVAHYTKDKVEDVASFVVITDQLKNLGATGPEEGESILPLSQNKNSDVNNYYNYVILHTEGSSLTKAGRGNYETDIRNGRFHIGIGSDRGVVKSISFAKADMQYVREARFQQNGIDGLMQLSAVYTATIEMFGNTIFYPGMEVYINPYGIGGTILGSPTQSDSIANRLGFGGYHTITSVKTNLKPGSYTTTIEAMWYFSGDSNEQRMDQQGFVRGDTSYEAGSLECDNLIIDAETTMMRLQQNPDYFGGIADPTPTLGSGTSKPTLKSSPVEQASSLGGGYIPPAIPDPGACPVEETAPKGDVLPDEKPEVTVTNEDTTKEKVIEFIDLPDVAPISEEQKAQFYSPERKKKIFSMKIGPGCEPTGTGGELIDTRDWRQKWSISYQEIKPIVGEGGFHETNVYEFHLYPHGVVGIYTEYPDSEDDLSFYEWRTQELYGKKLYFCKGDGINPDNLITSRANVTADIHQQGEDFTQVIAVAPDVNSQWEMSGDDLDQLLDNVPEGMKSGYSPGGAGGAIDLGVEALRKGTELLQDMLSANGTPPEPQPISEDVLVDDGPEWAAWMDEATEDEFYEYQAQLNQRSPIGGMTLAEEIVMRPLREGEKNGVGLVDDFYGLGRGMLVWDGGGRFRFYTGKTITHHRTGKKSALYKIYEMADGTGPNGGYGGPPGPKDWNSLVRYYNDLIGFDAIPLEAQEGSLAAEQEATEDPEEKTYTSRDGWTYQDIYDREYHIRSLPPTEKGSYMLNNPAPYRRVSVNSVKKYMHLYYEDNTSEIIWREE